MFIGHFALGFAAKSYKPALSLGIYFLAVQFVDLLWPTLLLFNMEEVVIDVGNTAVTPLNFIHYPISHSLVMALVWGLIAFLIIHLVLRKSIGLSVLVALCTISHWILDFITHRPDLPLTLSESVKVGLGLWNYKIITIIIETTLFLIAVWWYSRTTEAINKTGTYAFWGLVGFFLIIHLSNMFGPPPPNVSAIAWAGHLQWLFIVWAFWIDKNRRTLVKS